VAVRPESVDVNTKLKLPYPDEEILFACAALSDIVEVIGVALPVLIEKFSFFMELLPSFRFTFNVTWP
jgi:hypothetical protein